MENINSEQEFENHIRRIIKLNVLPSTHNLKLMDNKDVVDIIICRKGNESNIFFIEIKYQKNSSGRWGIGGERGTGLQPEILSGDFDFFESNLRWILGSESNDYYYFVDNSIIRSFAQGGEIGMKFNGIKKELLNQVEQQLTQEQLVEKIKEWLLP